MEKFPQLRVLLLCFLVAGVGALMLACTEWGQPTGPTNSPVPTAPPTPTPTPTPPPDPRAILARAGNQLAAVPYLEFVLEHPVGSTPLATGLNLAGAEGVARLPDRFRLALEMEASGAVLKLNVIVVGEQAFMTNLFSGDWESAPREQIPFRFDFVAEAIAGLLDGIEEASLVGETDLDGDAAYHVKGIGPTEALSQLIPGALPDSTIPVELWVDKADGSLRQVRLTGPLVADDLADTVRVVQLKALEEAPEIEAPDMGVMGTEN
jgi:hypothetical protein